MTDPAWHLAAEQIDRYAALTLSPSAEASVEAHLEACARCRADVASSAAVTDLTPRLERTWTATADRIDAPPAGWLERLAGLVGVPDHLARLIGVSGAFRTAWLTSVLLAMVAGLGAASGDLPPVLFLLLSPLVPVVGVTATYGGSGRHDARAFELATPYGELRLVLLRAAAVTVASLLVLGLVSATFAEVGPAAAAWLLPALALTASTLALSTRVPPERAASVVAVGWLLALQLAAVVLPPADRPTTDDLGALAVPLQLAAAAVLLVAAGAFAARRDLIDLPDR